MLSADVARCNGDYCSLRHCCLRYITPPVPDHPRQVFIGSPQTFDKEIECESFMSDPKISKRKIEKLKEGHGTVRTLSAKYAGEVEPGLRSQSNPAFCGER